MNEAFTIGNSNSIYTFGPKITLCPQASYTGFNASTPGPGYADWLWPEDETARTL